MPGPSQRDLPRPVPAGRGHESLSLRRRSDPGRLPVLRAGPVALRQPGLRPTARPLRPSGPGPSARHIRAAPEPVGSGGGFESSQTVAARVAAARHMAAARGLRCNADLPASSFDELAPLTPAARAVLEARLRQGRLSARGLHRIRRVARTLADLAGRTGLVEEEDVCAALVLRDDAFRRRRDGGIMTGHRPERGPAEAYAAALAAYPGIGPARLLELVAHYGPRRRGRGSSPGASAARIRRPGRPARDGGSAGPTRPPGSTRSPVGADAGGRHRRHLPRPAIVSPRPAARSAAARRVFWIGDLASLDKPCVAVVGTRQCTSYGRAMAAELGRDLADAGCAWCPGWRWASTAPPTPARWRPGRRLPGRLAWQPAAWTVPTHSATPSCGPGWPRPGPSSRRRLPGGRTILAVSGPQPDHCRPVPGRRRGRVTRRGRIHADRRRGGRPRCRRPGRSRARHQPVVDRDQPTAVRGGGPSPPRGRRPRRAGRSPAVATPPGGRQESPRSAKRRSRWR